MIEDANTYHVYITLLFPYTPRTGRNTRSRPPPPQSMRPKMRETKPLRRPVRPLVHPPRDEAMARAKRSPSTRKDLNP